MNRSLTRTAIHHMIFWLTLIILVMTGISYSYIYHLLTEQSLEQLQRCVTHHSHQENHLFLMVANNHASLKQTFLSRYQAIHQDPQQRFNQIFTTQPDGRLILKPQYYTGFQRENGEIVKNLTGHLPKTTQLTLEIRRRLVVMYDLARIYGPIWFHRDDNHRFDNLYFATPENYFVAYYPQHNWNTTREHDFQQTEWMKISKPSANPQRKTVWTGVYYDDFLQEWMISCETPVDVNGQHVLTIGTNISLNDLLHVFKEIQLPGSAQLIFQPNGRLISYSPYMDEIKQQKGKFFIQNSEDPALQVRYQKITQYFAQQSAPVPPQILTGYQNELLGVTQLASTGWYFVIIYPRSLITNTVLTIISFIFGLGLVALAVQLFTLFWVLTRHISKPVHEFIQATEQLSQGRFELSLSTQKSQELARLAQAFNDMSQELAHREQTLHEKEQQLQDYNRKLEAEVQIQTEEMATQNEELRAQSEELVEKNNLLLDEVEKRRRTEEILRKSEERFELAMQATNDGLIDWDLKDNKIYYSPRWKAIIGYRDRELPNQPDEWEKHTLSEDIPRIKQTLEAYLEKRIPHYEITFQMRHKHGYPIWILARAIVIWDKEGNPLRLVGTHVNITEQKQIEDALRQKEEFLRIIIDNIPQYIFWKDERGIYLGCNRSFARLIGFVSPEQIVGKRDIDLWADAELAEKFRQDDQEVMEYNMPKLHIIEKTYQNSDNYRWLETNKMPLRETTGEVIGLLGTAEDITERKRMEEFLREYNQKLEQKVAERTEALRQSQERLDLAMRGANDGLWDYDLKNDQVYYSPRFKEIIGYREDDKLSLTDFIHSLHPDEEGSLWKKVNDYLEKRTNHYEAIHRLRHKQGHYLWVMSRAIGVWDEQGTPARLVGTISDITMRKQTEIALKVSEQKYRQLYEELRDGIYVADFNGKILEFNPAFQRIVGYSQQQIHQLNYQQLTPEAWQGMEETILKEVKTNGYSHLYEKEYIRQNGERVPVEMQVYLRKDEQGNANGLWGIVRDITERKQVEAALRDANSRFDLVNSATNEGLWDVKVVNENPLHEANRIWFSARLRALLGYESEEDFPSRIKTWVDCLHPDDKELVMQKLIDHIRDYSDQTNFDIEYRLQTKTGEYRWYRSIGASQRDDTGKAIRFAGSLRDVTERKQAEEALQAAYTDLIQFKATLDLSQDIFIMLDDQAYLFFYANQGAIYTLGYSYEEFYTMYPWSLDAQSSKDKIIEHLTRVKQSGQVDKIETYHRCKDGRVIPVELSLQYIEIPEQINRFVAIARDITERKRTEQELKEHLQVISRFKALLDATSDFVGYNDLQGQLSYVNPAGLTMVGRDQQFVNQTVIADYMPAEVARQFYQEFFPTCLHEGIWQGETVLQHLDGDLIPISQVLVRVNDEEGNAVGFGSIARDISEQKRTEATLKELKEVAEQARLEAEIANQAKSTFLANMSHELRTPLNGILGYAQILLRDKNIDEEQQESLQIIQRSGDYLLTLINDILDLAKIEANRVELYPTDFDFAEFLQGINELFTMRAKQKGIAYLYEPLSHLPLAVHADEKRLRQILINLLGNAVKFTESGGVTLKVGYDQGKVRFQVEDTGIGIAQEEIDKIFTPFQQVGDHRYRAEGTGLGLSITQKLIEMMGGELRVESTLGRGSIFWMALDLAEVEKPKQSELEKKPVIVGFEHKQDYKLLVVDDKWENRSVIVKLLEPLGFEVLQADDGKIGLELLLQCRPDLVMTDLVMPVMDGFELTRRIRELPEFADLPIIAVTASVFDFHQQRSYEVGCNDFISKPVRADILLDSLQEHLDIEWIYETPFEEEKDPEREEMVLENCHLSNEQAEKLYDLAMRGHINGLLQFADELEKAELPLYPLVEKIRQLTENFEIKELCELAKQNLD